MTDDTTAEVREKLPYLEISIKGILESSGDTEYKFNCLFGLFGGALHQLLAAQKSELLKGIREGLPEIRPGQKFDNYNHGFNQAIAAVTAVLDGYEREGSDGKP